MSLFHVKRITFLYLFILLVAALVPMGPSFKPIYHTYTLHIRWDYLLHVLVYIPLPLLLGLSLKEKERRGFKVALLSILITASFEAIQFLIPYRAFNINDMLANGLGVIFGLIPVMLLWRRFSGFVK